MKPIRFLRPAECELLEDLADLTAVAERMGEPTFSHAKVVAELREDGYL